MATTMTKTNKRTSDMSKASPTGVNNKVEDLINHFVFKEGTGPNGSGGEVRYWKGDQDIPAAQAIQDYVTQQCIEARHKHRKGSEDKT